MYAPPGWCRLCPARHAPLHTLAADRVSESYFVCVDADRFRASNHPSDINSVVHSASMLRLTTDCGSGAIASRLVFFEAPHPLLQ